MLRKLLIIGLFLFFLFPISFPKIVLADPPDDIDHHETFITGKILQVISAKILTYDKAQSFSEDMKVQLLEGVDKGKITNIVFSGDGIFGSKQKINAGDTVVVDVKPAQNGKKTYSIYESYRLDNLWWVLAGFIILIIVIAGKRGIGALVGLGISITILALYVIPQIIAGADPLNVSIKAAVAILILTTYIAHGISTKTTAAVIGTAISLFIAGQLSIFCVQFLHLLGLGNQDLYDLLMGTTHRINPQGLLLGGILIGTLGALNDITTTQAIAIFTLVKENPQQKILQLFQKGMIIGREHIASLVNTLVLAYAGSSLSIFLFFVLNPAHIPLWIILNNETTIEEIIRALVGSSALILAVPITTFLASVIALNGSRYWYFTKAFVHSIITS